MTTKPSDAPWADEPHRLIPSPYKHKEDDNPWVEASVNICQAHNFLLRSLNSIVLQAPQVQAKHAKDFLFYVSAWTKTVKHHYWVQESHVFGQFERVAGEPGLLNNFKEQHRIVALGVDKLRAYCDSVDPSNYRSKELLSIVDTFAKVLTDDLHNEVKFFAKTNKYDREAQAKLWNDSLREAKQEGNLAMMSDVLPIILGSLDLTYEGGWQPSPLPAAVPYAIQYWFALGNNAWQFCPCDFFGKPRPLAFGPK